MYTITMASAHVQGPHQFLVYGLRDPRTQAIRYIGRSSSGLTRPKQHWLASRNNKSRRHSVCWLRELAEHGLRCEIVVLQTCTSVAEASEAERFWIVLGRSAGTLTNHTDGGEGRTDNKGKPLSLEHRANISAARKASPAVKAAGRRAAEMMRGKPRSPATIEKLRRADPQRRATMAERFPGGYKHSPEHLKRFKENWREDHPRRRRARPRMRINLWSHS